MPEEYETQIKDIENNLAELRKFIDNNPEDIGAKTNYRSLEQILYELKLGKLKKTLTEIFKHTKNELGMGGDLKFIQWTDNMDFFLVESEHRMDSNMMHTIMNHTNSTVLLGNSENNILVFRMKKEV